jgi:hypothetical protein
MNKNTFRLVLALVSVVLFSSFAHQDYDSVTWQKNKVIIDGKIPEWPNPLRFFDSESKINYALSNDSNNLYICIKVTDEATQVKIMRSGIEFMIDTLGKKSFPVAFIFPLANEIVMEKHSDREMHLERDPREKPNPNTMRTRMLNHAKDAKLVGFKPSLGSIIPVSGNTCGIFAAIAMDSLGIMYYEACLPFRTFCHTRVLPADTNRVFSFRIKINAIKEAAEMPKGDRTEGDMDPGSMQEGPPPGGGVSGDHHGRMGGGGRPGQGPHGGPGNGPPANNSEMDKEIHITKKLRISLH